MASAPCRSAAAAATASSTRNVPSATEYSVCTRRCTKAMRRILESGGWLAFRDAGFLTRARHAVRQHGARASRQARAGAFRYPCRTGFGGGHHGTRHPWRTLGRTHPCPGRTLRESASRERGPCLAAERRRLPGAVDARREPDEVAPRPHHLVFRDVPARALRA